MNEKSQKFNQFVKHLPFLEKIKENSNNELSQIKLNLAKSIVLNELRPGLMHWTNRLQTFINEYGLNFSKKDHLDFIEIYLHLTLTKDIDLVMVHLFLSTLIELLKLVNS